VKAKLSLIGPGTVVREFSAKEASLLAIQWLEVFGNDRHGVNTKAYLWHAFSGNRYPNSALDRAVVDYEQQQAHEYVVLSNDRDVAFVTDVRAGQSSLIDWLVFPPNLARTAAFTHEDGYLGPFFAKHPLYDQLNAANLAKLQKAREKESARLNGWR
jgi:hypothetical protein